MSLDGSDSFKDMWHHIHVYTRNQLSLTAFVQMAMSYDLTRIRVLWTLDQLNFVKRNQDRTWIFNELNHAQQITL